MNSIIKRPGYGDRHDRSRRQHAIAFPDLGRDHQGIYLQSTDINEMQSRALDQVRRVGDYIIQDGRIMDGQYPIVDEPDSHHIRVRLPACPIYMRGLVHDVDEAVFILPNTGELVIGVRSQENLVTDIEDSSLKGSVPGTEAFMEEGAARVEIILTWGHSLETDPRPLQSVFQVRDGKILTVETNTDQSEIYKSLEKYSRESNGSFVNTGFDVTAVGLNGAGKQVLSIAEGVAYVSGRRIVRQQSMRVEVTEEPDLRNVDAEPHPFTAATGGTQIFKVSKTPIESVRRVVVEKETTETVLHGPFSGAVDPLQHPSVTAILEIKQGGTVYTSPASWILSQGQIDWSPNGAEPSPGSNYTVKYRYNENIQPDAVTRDTVTVTGAANGTNVLLDYAYKLPRIDALCLDMAGAPVYIKGVSAVSRPRRPVIPESMIELARLHNDWGRPPAVQASGVRNVPYDEITDMRTAIVDLYDLVAQERLKNDVTGRDVGAKRGLFVDPLRNDAMRDQGIPQTAAVFGGKMTMPIIPRLHEFPSFVGIRCLAYTEYPIITQPRRSSSKKINPYQTFTRMPGRASVEPSTDIFTDRQTGWTSPQTQSFEAPEGEYISGISLEQRVEKIGERIVQAEFVRQRDVNFRLEGFIENEKLTALEFDGIALPVTAYAPANADGVISGIFAIPANVPSGSKTVFFEGSANTRASCTYVGRGEITIEEYRLASALETSSKTMPQPVINNTVINNITNVNNVSERGGDGGGRGEGRDPLAQTFTLVNARCLSAIRLWCAKKGSNTNAVLVQIRTCEVGMPTSIVLAEAFVPATDLTEGEQFVARFRFPVYLEAGREYAFVVLTDDAEHSLYTAEIGKIDIDTDEVITGQPFTVGVLLSSSNASTWTVHNEADLWFDMLACKFDPVERVIPIGSFKTLKMSDMIVRAGVEIPDPEAEVLIRLTRSARNEIITSAPSQIHQFADYIQNEDIVVEAVLRGSEHVTPFLFPDVQIVEGELQPTADYYTRAIDATDTNKVLVTFDAFLPAGSGAQVSIGVPDSYVQVNVSSATPLGDGVVEQTYIRASYPANNLDAQTKVVITGTPAARPEIKSMRMLLSKV